MIKIGVYKLGLAPFSMIIVFIVLSVCAIAAAFQYTRPEYPMPLLGQILKIGRAHV